MITIIKEEFNSDFDLIKNTYVYDSYMELTQHDFSIFMKENGYTKIQRNEYVYGQKFRDYLEAILETLSIDYLEDITNEVYETLIYEMKESF